MRIDTLAKRIDIILKKRQEEVLNTSSKFTPFYDSYDETRTNCLHWCDDFDGWYNLSDPQFVEYLLELKQEGTRCRLCTWNVDGCTLTLSEDEYIDEILDILGVSFTHKYANNEYINKIRFVLSNIIYDKDLYGPLKSFSSAQRHDLLPLILALRENAERWGWRE
ncbi:MAG: hypothetical protein P1Q69_10495 [Candidatus Thorarchaeota archaeon]|nr:hypothetical protein [Candidatus Thorarchaeota archaeon]